MTKIHAYLHEGNNKKEVYDTDFAKNASEGGLNLINVWERIKAIEAKQIFDSEFHTPESDIFYNISIKQKSFGGKTSLVQINWHQFQK